MLAAVAVVTTRDEPTPDACDRYAESGRADAGVGTAARPYRTVAMLVASLRAGDTGCLRGAFREDVTIRAGGITLASDPDAPRATLRGRLYIAETADGVAIHGLLLDGRPATAARAPQLPSPTVTADRVRFVDNEVTNRNTGICFVLGSGDYGTAHDTVLERNRIHHCGRLPPTNHDHGVYVAVARGTVIRDNVIYANADRGVQLYPDSQRALVEHNVIDGNGSGVLFAGDDGAASSGNVVRANVITNSTARYDVSAFWDGPVGVANVVEDNCLWGGVLGEFEDAEGYTPRGNVVADPQYVDRSAADFRLAPGSPCAGKGPRAATGAPLQPGDAAAARAQ